MNYNLAVILTCSIFIPAIIGLIRINKISSTYYPFLFCIWLGSLNEVTSYTIGKMGQQTSFNNNVYAFFESLLFVWQFKKWRLFDNSKILYHTIIVAFICAWLIEHFIIHEIDYSTSYFRVLYSFVVVLMSINVVNSLIIQERQNLLINPVFLICIAFIIHYTYYVLVMAFWYYGLNFSEPFLIKVAFVMPYVNFLSNLLFGFAFLWIQPKQRFSLPSL